VSTPADVGHPSRANEPPKQDIVVRIALRFAMWGEAAAIARTAWTPALRCSWHTKLLVAAVITAVAHALGLPSPIDLKALVDHGA